MKKVMLLITILSMAIGFASCDTPLNPDDINANGFNIEPFERFFDDSSMKTLTIKITEEKWLELDTAMVDYFVRYGQYRTDYMVEADASFEDDEGTIDIERVGFRTRGNLSRDRIRNDDGSLNLQHFKVSFHENYDEKNAKRTVFELEEIDLKFNRNWDSTYLTEKYSLHLFQSFGVFAAQTTLVRLLIQIDDEAHDYGIYTAFEPIDDNFIKRRLTKEASQGNLYKTLWQMYGPANLSHPIPSGAVGIKDESRNYRPSYDLKTNKDVADHTPLRQFISEINAKTGEDFITYIENNFEVDMFLKYLAVGVLLGNPDDYRAMGNNYYLYQNSDSGKWMMIPYDYDHGMGQGWDGAPVFSNWTIDADIYTWGNLNASILNHPHYPHVLVDKLLNIPAYQLQYEDYLRELINPSNAYFSYDAFLAIYQTQQALYDSYTLQSMMPLPFGLRNIESYMDSKVASIQVQLDYYHNHPEDRGF
ncbi:MAG TPA: CotH kinase family protein [Acholeplasmataceae bacterium]|nr:CotH kinase family protein [Acholeplasmataceae bacterium]